MNSPLAKYKFRDDVGHQLENCVEYQRILALAFPAECPCCGIVGNPSCNTVGCPDYPLTPPPDAAVREAVEWMDDAWASRLYPSAVRDCWDVLLRAVQAPRLTREQVEAVQVAASLLKGKNGDRAWARRKLEAAFHEVFAGEVNRG